MALSELIWNSLDADATLVSVLLSRDATGGVNEIRIVDDGVGISEIDAAEGFSSLGGSWKRQRSVTRHRKRVLHGKEGKGRYAAFVLGAKVEWSSVSESQNGNVRIVIRGSADDLLTFSGDDPTPDPSRLTGTVVTIREVVESANALALADAAAELAEVLAFYLKKYPRIRVELDGREVAPATLQIDELRFDLPPIVVGTRHIADAVLTVVEWRRPMPKSLHLCDLSGFTLHTMPSGVRAAGIEFSAYLSSSVVRDLHESSELQLPEMSPTVQALLDTARTKLREYVRSRRAAATAGLVEEWKKQGVYPFTGEPVNVAESTERQVFDILAANVQEYSPDFANVDLKTRKLSFQLVRQAIETNPASVQRILIDVLGLPKEKQNELAELLERTSLASIISAAKIVADRLDVLRALEALVHDPVHSRTLLERRQLQRILVDHAWIFGEQYHLAVDDQSLTEVLAAHRHIVSGSRARQRQRTKEPKVRQVDGANGIVDMMLSKAISRADGVDREHLVVELKRPSKKIDKEVLGQTMDYALAVAEDPRFREVPTKWVFWAVSVEMDAFARRMTRTANLPRGVYAALNEGVEIIVVAKTWGEIFSECRGRLKFFQSQLDWKADRGHALRNLRRTHGRYFPQSAIDETDGEVGET